MPFRARETTIPVRRIIPSLITSVSLGCGLSSFHFAVRGEWERTLLCLALSALLDTLDGRTARLLRVTSGFGAILDSISDFLCFGVAPAFILHQWLSVGKPPTRMDVLILAALMGFALCAALRLARFTSAVPAAAPGEPIASGKFFAGMPTPAAAGCVLLPVLIEQSRTVEWRLPDWSVVLLTLAISYLMISRWPMFTFKHLRIGRRMLAPLLVLAGVLAILLLKDPWLTLAGICALYLGLIPLSFLAARRARPRAPSLADAREGSDRLRA